ncbi:MAG: hypothetical protein PF542_04105 [Nanoarchaeota archaeon]|nr:hypothetical protein [Nanoarchaeota archaeon]
MKNKDITNKLTYEELSSEIVDTAKKLDSLKAARKDENIYYIKDLRGSFLYNFDSYSNEEQQKISTKFSILDSYINDLMLAKLI